jgi:5-methylcytosine-specific restriction enzyme A
VDYFDSRQIHLIKNNNWNNGLSIVLVRDEIINFRFPFLEESSGRNREIKQFGPRKVEEIIYHQLFFDKDHRSLDKEILNKSDGTTKGRVSANILYYFGIKGTDEVTNKARFRGIFKDISLQQGIEIMENHLISDYPNKNNLVRIIQHLNNLLARMDAEEDTNYIEEIDEQIRERLHSSESIQIEDEVKPPRIANNINNSRSSFTRDANVAVEAVILADFKCEVDSSHRSFTSRKYGRQYVEAHHLVPMKYQERFSEASLDVHAIIVALCPNCHRLLHHGIETEYNIILRTLLESRQTRLARCE